MSGFEARQPDWEDPRSGADPATSFNTIDILEQLSNEATIKPVLVSLEFLAVRDRGFSSFVEAGYKRAEGRPLRLLTADMLEERLNYGEYYEHDDAIFTRRINDLFKANEAQYDDEKDAWNKYNDADQAKFGEPLNAEDRMRERIEDLRNLEKAKLQESEKKAEAEATKKRMADTLAWMAEFNIPASEVELELGEQPEPETDPEPEPGSVESLKRLWAVSENGEIPGTKPATIYMEIDNLPEDNRNSAGEVDFLDAYPGLQKLREVLVESTYSQIQQAAPESGYRQEYLRNCVEQGVSSILIGAILAPSEFRRENDPKPLVDTDKLKTFQDAIKSFGSTEANSLTLKDAEALSGGLLVELAAANKQGRNLSTTELNVTKGYEGLRYALFTLEAMVLHDKGYIHPRAEKNSLATLFGGVLAACALTRALERQGGPEVAVKVRRWMIP